MKRWSHQSIAVKLPVAFVALFLAAFAALTIADYLEMHRTVVDLASSRLAAATSQLADLLGSSAHQRRVLVEALARDSAVAGTLRGTSSELSDAARTRLRAYIGSGPTARIELWDASGQPRFAEGAAFPPVSEGRRAAIVAAAADGRAHVSPLYIEEHTVSYTVSVPVSDEEGRAGLLVDRRRVTNQQQAIALIGGLIGSNAAFLVGNRDGSQWTDLAAAVPDPPIIGDWADGRTLDYERAGRRTLARAAEISDTEWLVVLELPRDVVLAPAERLLWRAVAIAGLLGLVTAALASLLSRRITAPLLRVTDAAQALADARPVEPVVLEQEDEIGRLAACFNTMSQRVEQSRRRYEELVQDLEDRVRARTVDLQVANAELESFSYSVSHDLRAPLRAIGGFAEILAEEATDQLNPSAAAALEVIQRNVRQMGALIDDLLAFSRLGRQAVTRSTVDMKALATSILGELASQDPRDGLTVEIADLPAASGDRAMLRQVFQNLLQNALKFTRPRPQALITVGVTAEPGGHVFFVRDNGVGFDMRYADKLFGVFQRLHRDDEFEGTGVGLAIVQRIVHRHGGRVWAESALGQGATFFFSLPTER